VEGHEIVFIGANPAVLLLGPAGPSAFASLWCADWTPHGPGRALVLVHDGRMRVLGPRPDLSRWLVDTFVRHFGEVQELTRSEPEFEDTEVEVKLDLATGVAARAGDVGLQISGIAQRSPFRQDGLTLGGTTYDLSNVSMPCEHASIEVAGRRLDGEPSPAFLAVAEVWTIAAGH
jgi:hypothetical protein